MGRTLSVSRKTLRSLKHDRRTVGFLVLMPLVLIALFGYTFGGDVKGVSVIIVDLDQGSPNGSIASSIINELKGSKTLKIVEELGPGGSDAKTYALDRIKDGGVWAAIVFDENFSRDVMAALSNLRHGLPALPSTVHFHVDATNPNIAQAVYGEIQRSVQIVIVSEYHLVPPIAIDEDRIYGEGAEFIDFFAPGVMGLAAMMVTFMLSIISFVHERTTGTLERLLTTPVTEGEIVAGYALAFGFVGLIQSLVILTTAVILFQIQIAGSALLALLIIFLLGVGNQGLGFLLSSNAKNEFQAVQFMPIILFPSILLAGVFWPLEAVPEFLRPISYFLPLTYAVDGTRSVMIRGWGIDHVWLQVTILVVFAAAMLLLSAYSLKKRR
ncbi:MAG: ABC transporter permease [Methanomassiliicoccales archaeon]|nr:ABC transporter permease [Methanomassiliicoccales archaeon]MDD1773148.1 ABC transporter permease [Methanomassiliicoccales archaeon]